MLMPRSESSASGRLPLRYPPQLACATVTSATRPSTYSGDTVYIYPSPGGLLEIIIAPFPSSKLILPSPEA